MICFPTAKINIGLNILEKRPDGFHNLESVFYPVGWSDGLEIIPSGTFRFTSSGIPVSGEPDENLSVKVYQSLKQQFGLPPVNIHLHKNIPIGAGLGGGSSDAAFTVKLLNKIFDLGLSKERMQDLVRPFGSDCAFFIANQPVFAYDKGDRFEDIGFTLQGMFIVLVYPDVHISTQEAYQRVTPKIPSERIKPVLNAGHHSWKEKLGNDFEAGIFLKHPSIAEIKTRLSGLGAVYTSMSGSGSTVYGIFEKEVDVEDLFPSNYRWWKGYLN